VIIVKDNGEYESASEEEAEDEYDEEAHENEDQLAVSLSRVLLLL